MSEESTHIRTCPFCEATCGLSIELDGREVVKVRGDAEDVFSKGFICPKATGIQHLSGDPDRLRTPLIKQADGSFAEASWDEAFALIAERLPPILEEHGRNAVGVYVGNPNAHNLSALTYGPVWVKALGSRNVFTASSVDQMPKHVSAGLMFGTPLSIPIPDVDRTDHLLVLGANPLVSNGSLLTAPNMRGRLRAISERGGKVVVIDPRRTRTAEAADEHHFIRPGGDAFLLMAMVHVLFAEGLVEPGALNDHLNGLDEVEALARDFPPEAVEDACGIGAAEIRRMARELAAAPRAAVYGRMGTTTQQFGTIASWLIDVLNALTGNLDREGGSMFTTAAAGQKNSSGQAGSGRGFAIGRWESRVRGLPEAMGELPVSVLAEEMDTEGEGRIRALVTQAGNPLLSTPNSERLRAAVERLDFMVSIDIYVNETTRHADVILPAPGPLEKAQYDLVLYQLAARNVANYSPAILDSEVPAEWETLARLTGIVTGQGPDVDIDALDGMVIATMVHREVADEHSRIAGRDAEEILAELAGRRGPERMLDLLLRVGHYGDAFGADPDGLTLAVLEDNPHGVDLGPLQPRIPDVLRTASGRVELAPEPITADVPRLRERLGAEAADGGMTLVGRRQLRSNNSWMHNLEPLVKGKERCTAQVHPEDAARLGLAEGSEVVLRSAAGRVRVPVEITDEVMPGVVSMPHGWGHDQPGVRMGVAAAHHGVNSNVLSDESVVEGVAGNAVLNGIPVALEPVVSGTADAG